MISGLIFWIGYSTFTHVGFFAQLSPKKTYEGFVGGGIITVLLGTFLASYMVTPYLICPVQVSATSNLWSPFTVDTDCTPNSVFIEREMQVTTNTPIHQYIALYSRSKRVVLCPFN